MTAEVPGPELMAAALSCAARGWKVFPCAARGKLPCKEKDFFEHGVSEASSSRFWVERFWKRWPAANIGAAGGEESGFWVLDADLKPENDEDGFRTLRELEELFGEALPETLGQITPSGGRHWLFRWPDRKVPNSSRAKCGPGLDTRGEGGYILVAPSIHPNGKRYVWTGDPETTPIAAAPEWLVRLVIGAGEDLDWLRRALEGKTLPAWMAKRLSVPKAPAGADRAPPPGGVHPYARKALDEEAQKVRNAVPGSRNSTLNEAAFNLGQFIPNGHLPRSLIEQHLYVAALACFGSDQRELIAAQKTIKSGIEGGMQHPRELPPPLEPQRRSSHGGRSGSARRPLRQVADDPKAVEAAVAEGRRLWALGGRLDGAAAQGFLRAAGVDGDWRMLRLVDTLDLTHTVPGQGKVLLHRGPAVLAAMQVWSAQAAGPELSGVLATWIDGEGRPVEVEHASLGRPVPARRVFGRRGGAVRLSPLGEAGALYLVADLPLGLRCARAYPNVAVWVAGGVVAMADVVLPEAVHDVLLIGAGDLSREREATIAAALGHGAGRTVLVARTTAQKARAS